MAGVNVQRDPNEVPTHPAAEAFKDLPSIRSGWVMFAGSYMVLAGLFDLIWGITALSKKSYFVTDGLVWSTLSTWGWIAIIYAAIQIVAGGMLFARKLVGVLAAIVISMGGIFINFLSLGAYPLWSLVVIVCNGLVLWAVTAHGNDFT